MSSAISAMVAKEKLELFRDTAKAAHSQLAAAVAAGGDELTLQLAKFEACRMIQQAADEQVQQYLAAMADPKIGMIEVVPCRDDVRPEDSAIAGVIVLAIMNGFVPGKEQFSVFGGPNRTAKLYVKRAGYERWFAYRGMHPDPKHEHPVFRKFGDSDKNVWVANGRVSCQLNGKLYEVVREGKFALGIPGYHSDAIGNVSTKMKRALLRELWLKVSAYALDEIEDDSGPRVDVIEPAAIENLSPKESVDRETFIAIWRKELTGMSPGAMQSAAELFESWEKNDRAAANGAHSRIVSKVPDTREKRKLELFFNAIRNDRGWEGYVLARDS